MADRQGGPYHSDDAIDTPAQATGKAEGDPLAELARLIGQADPFSKFGRGNVVASPGGARVPRSETPTARGSFHNEMSAPPGSPSWMQNRAVQTAVVPDEPLPVDDMDLNRPHPLRRYATAPQPQEPASEPAYDAAAPQAHQQPAGDRYDDALYGQPDPGYQAQQDQPETYAADGYAYPDAYAEDDNYNPPRRRGLMTVAAIVALAVLGTGGAFAYRTFIASPRSGEPPVIKADTGPTKVVPPSAAGDNSGKLIQDRMATGTAPEQLVSREETPVDPRDPTKAGPRVIFPPLTPANSAPAAPAVAPTGMQVAKPASGDEPRKVRTLTVKGDQNDVAATPAAKPASRPGTPAAARTPASNANASANGPMSLSPQTPPAAEPRQRVGATAPAEQPAPASSGGYVVQVSSQRNEADAQASYRALQGKFPSVLGSRQPLIKRADLGDKGVYYRALVGPFGNADEAAAVCGNLKTAGGQCVVQRN